MNYISLNIAFSDDLQAEILTAETRLAGSHNDDEKKRLQDTLVQLREFKHVFEQRKAA